MTRSLVIYTLHIKGGLEELLLYYKDSPEEWLPPLLTINFSKNEAILHVFSETFEPILSSGFSKGFYNSSDFVFYCWLESKKNKVHRKTNKQVNVPMKKSKGE